MSEPGAIRQIQPTEVPKPPEASFGWRVVATSGRSHGKATSLRHRRFRSKQSVHQLVSPRSELEEHLPPPAFERKARTLERSLFRQVLGIGQSLRPVRGREAEQMPDQLLVRRCSESAASVLRQHRQPNLVASTRLMAGIRLPPGHADRLFPLSARQRDSKEHGIRADVSVALPAFPAAPNIAVPAPHEYAGRVWIDREPIQERQVGLS